MSARRLLLFAVAAAALLIGAFVAYATLRPGGAPPKFEAVDITGVDWGRGFDLTDHHGKRRALFGSHAAREGPRVARRGRAG